METPPVDGSGKTVGRKIVYDCGFLSVEQDPESGFYLVRTTNAAAILVYVPKLDAVVMIEQERVALVKAENPTGISNEVPAGRFDRDTDLVSLLQSELEEEAGIRLGRDAIKILNGGIPLSLAPGVLTERAYLAYAEAEPDDIDFTKAQFGVKAENEKILRRLVPVAELPGIQFDNIAAWGLVNWFLLNKVKREGRL